MCLSKQFCRFSKRVCLKKTSILDLIQFKDIYRKFKGSHDFPREVAIWGWTRVYTSKVAKPLSTSYTSAGFDAFISCDRGSLWVNQLVLGNFSRGTWQLQSAPTKQINKSMKTRQDQTRIVYHLKFQASKSSYLTGLRYVWIVNLAKCVGVSLPLCLENYSKIRPTRTTTAF